jgi:hypothetical protein
MNDIYLGNTKRAVWLRRDTLAEEVEEISRARYADRIEAPVAVRPKEKGENNGHRKIIQSMPADASKESLT